MKFKELKKILALSLAYTLAVPSNVYAADVQVQTENCPTGWTTFKPQTDKKLSTSNKQRKTNEKPIRNYDYEEGDSL